VVLLKKETNCLIIPDLITIQSLILSAANQSMYCKHGVVKYTFYQTSRRHIPGHCSLR